MRKTSSKTETNKTSNPKPASKSATNPNYPSTTGNKSGGNRGNTPKR